MKHRIIFINILILLTAFQPLLSKELVTGITADNYKAENFTLSSPRCSDKDFSFTAVPDFLLGSLSISLPRGVTTQPFTGTSFTLSEESIIYIFVQKRANPKIPDNWTKTKYTADWKFSKFVLQDEIYQKTVPAGLINIPGHYGESGSNYGAPHFIVIIPNSQLAEKIKKANNVKQEWPSEADLKKAKPAASALWNEFLSAPKKNHSITLPDFSYAGYHMGQESIMSSGTVFSVTDYGAKPDDTEDDSDGIQAAINAAADHNGGVVFLPKGRYLVNTTMENRRTIKITSSRIILRGEGSGAGGTIIHQIQPFDTGVPASDPRHYHLGESVFTIQSEIEDRTTLANKPVLADITGFSTSDIFSITVNQTSSLKPEDDILILSQSSRLMKEMIKPYETDPEWTAMLGKPYIAEIHRIKKITGNSITFYEPIRYEIKKEDSWSIRPFQPIRENGVEDICFMGNAYHAYVHHRSDLDDSGWAFIKMKGITDSWIRRCSFINASQTIYVSLASYVSVLNIFVAGNKGHHIPRVSWYTYGVLAGLCLDQAQCTHGPSVNQGAVGTVFWRWTIGPQEPIDNHSGRPFCTLFDRIDGGSLYGSSGGERDYPQHLRKLVIWNFKGGVVPENNQPLIYDFWRKGMNDRFVKPIISGFHGSPALFNENSVEKLESLGIPVEPESLYEAQLALRLGSLPNWVNESKAEFEKLKKSPLPQYYTRGSSKPYKLIEMFSVENMLGFITKRPLRMYGKEFFSYTVNPGSLQIQNDQGLLRQAAYASMYALISASKNNNNIRAVSENKKDLTAAALYLETGEKISSDTPDMKNHASFLEAQEYMTQLGGTAELINNSGTLQIKLFVPSVPK